MLVITRTPPNYDLIWRTFKPKKGTLFAYGSAVYNPSKIDIPDDVLIHEQAHLDQQWNKDPKKWWIMYCSYPDFRFKMELEAFQKQYKWVAERVPRQFAEMCLRDLSNELSTAYKLDLTAEQAYNQIKDSGTF